MEGGNADKVDSSDDGKRVRKEYGKEIKVHKGQTD